VTLRPRAVADRTTLAILHQLQGDMDKAKTSYEKALEIDARSGVAANNLAQYYADRNENLEVALQLAQTAKASMPKAHEVDDTLGWVYYRKGLADPAIVSFRTAVAAQPDNAVYLYHLGAAYALKKDTANARQNLQKALSVQANFPGSDEARKILNSLK
jgi:tetratricopeptide (TPR) repeat protein